MKCEIRKTKKNSFWFDSLEKTKKTIPEERYKRERENARDKRQVMKQRPCTCSNALSFLKKKTYTRHYTKKSSIYL